MRRGVGSSSVSFGSGMIRPLYRTHGVELCRAYVPLWAVGGDRAGWALLTVIDKSVHCHRSAVVGY
jgi:hypothetical protein